MPATGAITVSTYVTVTQGFLAEPADMTATLSNEHSTMGYISMPPLSNHCRIGESDAVGPSTAAATLTIAAAEKKKVPVKI